ncbi:MAG: hypothetical protein KGL54_15090 [Sphingomonadales bacterium]|nr:hypothetical protein [Sphingomonadales bacterium]
MGKRGEEQRQPERYYRVGGTRKKHATLEEACAVASRYFARTGIVVSVEEHTARPRRRARG